MIVVVAVARRAALRAILAMLLLTTACAACSPSNAARVTSASTVPTEPAPTTTTNPYAVPAVIDAAYVNRVLAGLDAVIGDAARLVIAARTITTDVYDRLKAVYASIDFLQIAIDGFEADMREGFSSYKPHPGNTLSSVEQLLTVTPNCIFARIHRDYSQVGISPTVDVKLQWVALKPLDRTRDPKNYNSTSWALIYDGFPRDHSQPRDPCIA